MTNELTPEEKAFLAELRAEIVAVQHQVNGALRLMLRNRGLNPADGWQLVEDKFQKPEGA